MSSLKSSVASGLRDLLEKWTISDNDLRSMLLRFVKNRHCGRAELAGSEDPSSKQAEVKSTRAGM